MFSWPRPATIFKKSNFNHGVCLKDIPMKSGMLVAQKQWNQQAKFQGKYQILTSSLPLEVYSNSLQACVDSQPQSVRWWMKSGITPQGIPDKVKKIIRNASKSSKCVWKYALSPPLIITTQHCQWCIGVNIGYTPPLKIPHPTHLIIANLCANISRENRYDYVLEDLLSKLDDKTTPATQLLFQKFAQANNKENIKAQNQWYFVRGFVIGLLCYYHSQLHLNTKFWIQMYIYELP